MLLLREDCGTPEELRTTVAIAKLLMNEQPKTTVQNALVEETDLAEVRKEWLKTSKSGPRNTKGVVYADFLTQEFGSEFVVAVWLRHASSVQMQTLSVITGVERDHRAGQGRGS